VFLRLNFGYARNKGEERKVYLREDRQRNYNSEGRSVVRKRGRGKGSTL